VLIHNPYRTDLNSDSARNTDVQTLAINRKITALSSGCLGLPSSGERDSLLVGTETNLMAYDVDRNSDLFYKDVPDGVHSLIFGRVPNLSGPISLVGGNCSIQVLGVIVFVFCSRNRRFTYFDTGFRLSRVRVLLDRHW
jgi:Bardet-Biedl syndrome 2 protein